MHSEVSRDNIKISYRSRRKLVYQFLNLHHKTSSPRIQGRYCVKSPSFPHPQTRGMNSRDISVQPTKSLTVLYRSIWIEIEWGPRLSFSHTPYPMPQQSICLTVRIPTIPTYRPSVRSYYCTVHCTLYSSKVANTPFQSGIDQSTIQTTLLHCSL